MKTKSKIIFERHHVIEQEFQTMVDVFNPQKLTKPSLKLLCGTLDIKIGGYVGCQQNPIVVLEVRTFMRALGQRWGQASAAYFCDLTSPFYFIYLCAQLEHLLVIDRMATADYLVLPRKNEVEHFFREAALGIYTLGQQAGLTTSAIHRRQRQLCKVLASSFSQYSQT